MEGPCGVERLLEEMPAFDQDEVACPSRGGQPEGSGHRVLCGADGQYVHRNTPKCGKYRLRSVRGSPPVPYPLRRLGMKRTARHDFIVPPPPSAPRSGDLKTQTERECPLRLAVHGAEGGTRTPTPFRALPPQDSVSASSTTSARGVISSCFQPAFRPVSRRAPTASCSWSPPLLARSAAWPGARSSRPSPAPPSRQPCSGRPEGSFP